MSKHRDRYGRQTFYCSNCGRKLYCTYPELWGRNHKACSGECCKEFELKRAASILGQDNQECICPAGGRILICGAHGR